MSVASHWTIHAPEELGRPPPRDLQAVTGHLLGLGGCKKYSYNNFRGFPNKIHPNAYIKGTRVHDDAGVLQPKTFQNALDCFLPFTVSTVPIADLNSTKNFPRPFSFSFILDSYMQLSTMYSCPRYHCEFLPLQFEVTFRNEMFVLLQVINQNMQKVQNSTRSDPKCSKKNMNHVDIRLLQRQEQKQSLITLFTCTKLMHTSCWSGTRVHLFAFVLLCLRLSVMLCRT